MDVEIQYKIKSDSNNLRYLRENSYWYKYLNRNKINYVGFEKKMKEAYKITTEDRIKKVTDSIDALSKIINILN